VLSIKKSEEKKVRGQQKNRKQNGALPFQNSGTMNVLSWIDHDNEGDARAETNVASASATLSRPWGMVLSKYMLLPASRINSWSAIMALNLPSRIRPHSLSLWKKASFNWLFKYHAIATFWIRERSLPKGHLVNF